MNTKDFMDKNLDTIIDISQKITRAIPETATSHQGTFALAFALAASAFSTIKEGISKAEAKVALMSLVGFAWDQVEAASQAQSDSAKASSNL